MPKIPLVNTGFKLVSEGEHKFTVTKVVYNETYGKVQIHMKTESGEKHTEFFTFNGNEKAAYFFSLTAKALMGANEIDDVDSDDLVGKSMMATVTHYEGKDGKTYVRLDNKKPCSDGSTSESTVSESDETDDLDDLFGDL